MTDQNGNVFSNLPMSSGSVTLQIFETTGWLEDYVFYTDSENGIIILQEYTGSDSELTVPESVSVGGRDYLVKVYAGTWRSGITSLTLEGSDPFYDYLSTNFGDMRDLEVLDPAELWLGCEWPGDVDNAVSGLYCTDRDGSRRGS